MTAGQHRKGSAGIRAVGAFLAVGTLLASLALSGAGRAEEPVRLKIVGGLAGVTQYRLEEAFWTQAVPKLTGGRIAATIQPLDGGGLRNQEMLRLMKLGVVPFGTASASSAAEEAELNAIDLPGVNPDFASLRDSVARYREHMRTVLRDRYGIELLAVYIYPAQVVFCRRPFAGLDGLAGLRVRTSSLGQSELMQALGAVPVRINFADIVAAVKADSVDCAITGTLSGNEIGLADITTHIHRMAINWGVSVFGANKAAWDALAPDVQATLRTGLGELETRVWLRAAEDTEQGLACNTGAASCPPDRRKGMTLVRTSPVDEGRRRALLADRVIPLWVERCGAACGQAWNRFLAPATQISVRSE